MREPNGLLRLHANELAEFVKAPYPSSWWINTKTGKTSTTPGHYTGEAPADCAFLMDGPNPVWVFQWAGDWNRAVEEQLNPLLAAAFPAGAL